MTSSFFSFLISNNASLNLNRRVQWNQEYTGSVLSKPQKVKTKMHGKYDYQVIQEKKQRSCN